VRVDVGPEDEPAHQVGLTRLLVDVLAADGARERSREELDAWLAEHGASLEVLLEPGLGSLTGKTVTVRFRCAGEDLGEALALVRDLLVDPALGERAVESAKNRLLARFGRLAPGPVAERALVELLEGDAATGARLPHPADLAQLSADDLRAYQRAHVAPGSVHVALHGALPEGLGALLTETFGALAPESSEPPELTGSSGSDGSAAAPAPPTAPGGADPLAPAPREGVFLLELAGAREVEGRAGLAPGGELTPGTLAALALYASYRTRPNELRASPETPGEVPVAVGVSFAPTTALDGGRLTASVGVPVALAPEAIGALAAALEPAEGTVLDAARLEEARGTVLAVLAPADDGLRIREIQALERAEVPPERIDAVLAATRSLDGPAVVEAVRAYAQGRPRATVLVGPQGQLAPALAGVEGLHLRSGLRQPRGDAPALALRAELLDAVGTGWAEVATVTVGGVAEVDQVDEPVPVEIVRDLESGALVIRQQVFGQEALTVSTPEASWVQQAGGVSVLDPERHAALRHAEDRQLFRLLALLARGREVRLTAEGRRLDLWRGAERLGWFELGADGHPLAVGHPGDRSAAGEDSRTELAEWTTSGELAYPARLDQPARGTTHHLERFEAGHVPGAAIPPELLVPPGG
jgi:hypothetical protein